VELLCKTPEVAALVKQHRERFVKAVITIEDGDVARDVARKFSLVYAAGRLAIDFKLVPWTPKKLLIATRTCYFAARTLLPDVGVASRKGRSALCSFLGKLKRKKAIIDYKSEPGFVTRKSRHVVYMMLVDAFNAAFASREERDLALDWLRQEKLIAMASIKKGKAPRPKNQFVWPHGRRPRSYKVTLPRGSSLASALLGSTC
jgi:hypothetical protein